MAFIRGPASFFVRSSAIQLLSFTGNDSAEVPIGVPDVKGRTSWRGARSSPPAATASCFRPTDNSADVDCGVSKLGWDDAWFNFTEFGVISSSLLEVRTHDNHSELRVENGQSREQTYDCGGGNVRDTEVVRDVMDSGCLL